MADAVWKILKPLKNLHDFMNNCGKPSFSLVIFRRYKNVIGLLETYMIPLVRHLRLLIFNYKLL